MLASITPLGERGRKSRWGLTVTAFVASSAAAGTALGVTLGSLGIPLRLIAPAPIRVWILAVAILLAAPYEWRAFGLRLPTVHRQVNEQWLNRYRGWVYGAGFGAQLGAGIATIVTTAAVYAMLAALVLTGSPVWAALAGGTFGLMRGLLILPSRRVRTTRSLVSLDASLRRWERPVRVLTGVTLSALALVVAVGAAR